MTDNITTQSATLATIPASTEIETYDTGDGHRQIVTVGGGGSKAFSDPAPTTSAASIVAANPDRLSVTIHNAGSVVVYLGPSGVTTSTGLPLAVGATLTDTTSVDAWHAITASGTGDLRIIEVS